MFELTHLCLFVINVASVNPSVGSPLYSSKTDKGKSVTVADLHKSEFETSKVALSFIFYELIVLCSSTQNFDPETCEILVCWNISQKLTARMICQIVL